jgi:hypothetical protein
MSIIYIIECSTDLPNPFSDLRTLLRRCHQGREQEGMLIIIVLQNGLMDIEVIVIVVAFVVVIAVLALASRQIGKPNHGCVVLCSKVNQQHVRCHHAPSWSANNDEGAGREASGQLFK